MMDYVTQRNHSCGQTSRELISRNSAFQAKPASFTAYAPCECHGPGTPGARGIRTAESEEDMYPGDLGGCEAVCALGGQPGEVALSARATAV